MDWTQLDKADWTCLQSKSSIYYGQLAALVKDQPLKKEEADPSAPLVRHGLGIQTYPSVKDDIKPPFYKGSWSKDLKHGTGFMQYANGATFHGKFWQGLRHGHGKMQWPDGTVYEGEWKEGRFNGEGRFQAGQNCMVGSFHQGMFIQKGKIINPLTNEVALHDFRKKDLEDKNKHFYLVRIKNLAQIDTFVTTSISNNRIPLLLRTTAASYSKQDVFQGLGRTVFQFDLKQQAASKLASVEDDSERQKAQEQLREEIAKTLVEGNLLVINLDDNLDVEGLNSHPNIAEFYSAESLPCQIFSPALLHRKEVYQPITNGVEPSKKWGVLVWSQFKVEEGWQDKRCIQAAIKRFNQIIPILKIDFILIEPSS